MEKLSWHLEAKDKWNEKAGDWHTNSINMWDHGSRKDICPFFQKYVPYGNTADLGCGNGYGTRKLGDLGYQVTGVDLSDKMVELAMRYETDNVTFVQGDLVSLPFEADAFDALMAINSLEWTESPLLVLKEMKRVLKQGGKACVAILGPTAGPRANSYARLTGEQVVLNTIMPWEFEQLAKENGFKKIDVLHVYKNGVKEAETERLSSELKQALTFITVFMLEKE